MTCTTATGSQRLADGDQVKMPQASPLVFRRERLRDGFKAAVEQLHRCRPDLVPDGFIADYLALHWLEWCEGVLRVTTAGKKLQSHHAALQV